MTILYIVSGTTFPAPGGWPGSGQFEYIGGGGAGQAGNNTPASGTGGGGAQYGITTSLTVANGAALQVGQGGTTAGANGTDTWVGSTSIALAKGGQGAQTSGTAGVGGGISPQNGGVATTLHNGGSGGTYNSNSDGASGGGGSGGPNGAGANGGSEATSTGTAGGTGGGGGGGGSAGTNQTATPSTSGTNGGLGANGSGTVAGTSGAGATTSGSPNGGAGSASSNSSGGGGGGGFGTTGAGGNGGAGTEWDATHGSGGGGAGNCSVASGATPVPGNGGLYGGGGGGGGDASFTAFGKGANGIIVVTYTAATSAQPYSDEWDWGIDELAYVEDDQTLTLIIADSAPVGPNQPPLPVQEAEVSADWWQDYEDPLVEDSQWSGPILPNAPPQPVEDIWDEGEIEDDWDATSAPVMPAPPSGLPPDDAWEWTEDVGDEDLTDDGSNVENNNVVPVVPALPEDPWLHEDDHTDEPFGDEPPLGPNQPPLPVDDGWDWTADDDSVDESWIGQDERVHGSPITVADGWDWSEPDDASDEPPDDDGSNVQNANIVMVPPGPVEDGWNWNEPEDNADDPPDDDGSNVQNTSVVLLPSNGAEDPWNWDEESTEDNWWDGLDDGYNQQNNNVLPPAIGPPPTLPVGTLLPGDLGDELGTGMGPYKRPGQVFGQPDPVSPWLTSRVDSPSAPVLGAVGESSLTAMAPAAPEAVAIFKALGPDLTEADIAQILIALELLLHGGTPR